LTDVVCDLDGVLFRGGAPIPGAPQALRRLIASGARVVYATNNSTRSASRAAANITDITGVPAEASQVVTSAQAAASLLTGDDWPTLPVGEEGVVSALEAAGGAITRRPSEAASVVVGLDRSLSYEAIAGAADAVRAGARFVATNTDPTYPTPAGLAPGAGAVAAAIAVAAGRQPEVAGKPHPPMRKLLRALGVTSPWVIGDRLDTDVALADNEEGWASILVLTGVASRQEGEGRADRVVDDFAAAVDVVLGEATRP